MLLDEIKNKIINADCLEIMRQLPDKCIDLILTDPPYGINYSKNPHSDSKMNKKGWDNSTPPDEIFLEMFRVSKNQIIFGGNYFPILWKYGGRGFIFWNKQTFVPNFADGELAWTSFDRVAKCYNFQWAGFIKTGETEKAIHPTQKPLRLFEMILRDYAAPEPSGGGLLVADFFSGSGTTAVACHNLKLDFVCIEKDEDYFKASCKRLQDAQAQLKLF